MWIPRSTHELETLVSSGQLDETSQLDFKQTLPEKKGNAEIAVDVSAMTVDGGVLIYGVGEDEDRRPTRLCPIELAGTRERIDQVLQTSVHESPVVRFKTLELEGDASKGYLVTIIPPSPRAPHQVVARSRYQHRYYGRGATGNRVLTEPEIARLYARRQEWAFDAREHLTTVIGLAPFPPDPDLGFLHAYVRPVVSDEDRWTRASQGESGKLHRRMTDAAQHATRGLSYQPALADAPSWVRRGADAWRLGYGDKARRNVTCDVNFDGRGQLFCGRAADRLDRKEYEAEQPGQLVIFEQIVVGNLASFLALMFELYDAAGYFGPVDIGIALTGIRDAQAFRVARGFSNPYSAYPDDSYMKVARVDAEELRSARLLTASLLSRFFEALVGPGFDPFV